ncbi:MAG TPA: sugar phosphate isomerase/epimerase [Firmicutes bacterium]|nr:sugar phosphate isomerase/epimerase [Bacillota bacterium]
MKTALHTVSYAGLWPGQARLSLDQVISKAAALGFDGLEIMAKRPHLSVLTIDEEVDAIAGLLRRHGLACACLAAYTDFTGGADSPEVPFGEMQVLYITRLAQIAEKLGCQLIRVFTTYTRQELSYSEQWWRCVQLLRECAQRAANYGVTIGIQNHHDVAVTAAELKAMIKEIGEPNVKLCWDAWSPTLQKQNLPADTKMLKGLIAFTTVADYQLRPRFRYRRELVNYEQTMDAVQAVKMGEGIIDYRTFLKVLQEDGYDGYVSYEMCSPIVGGGSEENLDAYCRAFLSFMDDLRKG